MCVVCVCAMSYGGGWGMKYAVCRVHVLALEASG